MKNVFRLWKRKVLSYLEKEAVVNIIPKLLKRSFGANRYASEVGALNTLLYSGIIGLLLYWIIFFYASYKAINDSDNILSRMLGLFIILGGLFL